jgi:outer membrane lipoprotein-sorting protein
MGVGLKVQQEFAKSVDYYKQYSNQTRASISASAFEFKPPAGTEVSTPLGQ